MTFQELDTVVVAVDLPGHGLKKGDVGVVVQVYSPRAVEVEFVTAAGGTRAVVTLGTDQIRPVRQDDLLAVRRRDAA